MKTTENSTNNRRYGGEFKQWLGLKAVFGHLHEFREIPNSNPRAHSVRVSVPQGRGEYMQYSSLELIVDSLRVFHLLSQYADTINADKTKATLTFNCYGLHPKAYALKNADGSWKLNDQGELELRAFNAGKITHISYLKINGAVCHGGDSGITDTSSETARAANGISKHEKKSEMTQRAPAISSDTQKGKSSRKATA